MEVTANGISLAYSDRGNGIPLVYGHGLSASRAYEDAVAFIDWEPVGSTARMIRYDARGHGGSGATGRAEDYAWPALARDMLALSEALGLKRFVAGGASMGAAAALYAALAAPERIAGLVLVIPPTAWEGRSARRNLYRKSADMLAERGIEAWLAEMRAFPHEPRFIWGADPAREAAHLAYHRALDPARLAWIVRGAALSDLPVPDDLRRITCPALILAWAGDTGHPVVTAERLGEALSGAEVVVADTMSEFKAWGQRIRDFMAHLPAVD